MFLKDNKKLLFYFFPFCFFLFFWYQFTIYYNDLKKEDETHHSFNVKVIELDSWISEKKRLIENLTKSLELITYSKERHLEFMKKTNKIMKTNSVFSGFKNGLYFDTQGYWINDFDPRVRPWYMETLKNKKTTISGPMYYNDISGEKITWWAISVPFFKDGDIFGVVNVEILPEDIRKQIKDVYSNQFEDVFIFHKKTGRILFSIQKEKELQFIQDVFSKDIFNKFRDTEDEKIVFNYQHYSKLAYLFNLKEAPWVLCGIRKK